jgi:hypothetical protein
MSSNLALRITIMTPANRKIKISARESLLDAGFNVLQLLYLRAFVKRIKSYVGYRLAYYLSVCIATVQIFY